MLRKIINLIKYPKYSYYHIKYNGDFNEMSDKLYLELMFHRMLDRHLDLSNPKSFNEKIQWLKLNDRKDFYTNLVDKYKVREIIEKELGSQYLVPLIGSWDSFDDIDFDSLPNQFVIKCNHDSGSVFICENKANFDKDKTREKVNDSLSRNFYYRGREWPYKNIKRKVIIEELLRDQSSLELKDYKVLCFHGEPRFIEVHSNRSTENHTQDYFSTDWDKLDISGYIPSSKFKIEKPVILAEMILLSRKLSRYIPFVRVDWYVANDKLYFGELTLYPGSGYNGYNDKVNIMLGSLIDLKKVR